VTTDVEAWTCPDCNTAVNTRFCPDCGEHPLQLRELTLRGLLEQAVHAFTDVDGRLIRSVLALMNRPGTLTVAYLRGQRLPYIGPFALFLLANVLFLGMESATGSHIFSAPLNAHLNTQPWSPLAQELVPARLAELNMTLEHYAPAFDRAVAMNARSLVILMTLPLASLLPLLFYSRRLPFAAHAVFALHFFAFLLVLFSLALAIPLVDVLLGGPGLASQTEDNAIAIALIVFCAIYFFLGTRAVYGAEGGVRIFKTAVLAVAAAAIVLGYRFLLLLLTLYFVGG